MRYPALLIVATAAAICTGCATVNDGRERAFTREWSEQTRLEKAEREKRKSNERKSRAEAKKRVGVTGDDGGPKLRLGGKEGISADLGFDGGPEAGVKYRKGWNFAKPK